MSLSLTIVSNSHDRTCGQPHFFNPFKSQMGHPYNYCHAGFRIFSGGPLIFHRSLRLLHSSSILFWDVQGISLLSLKSIPFFTVVLHCCSLRYYTSALSVVIWCHRGPCPITQFMSRSQKWCYFRVRGGVYCKSFIPLEGSENFPLVSTAVSLPPPTQIIASHRDTFVLERDSCLSCLWGIGRSFRPLLII